MIRCPELPFLPGNVFDPHLGQTRFHKSHQLDFVGKGVPYINDRPRPGIGGAPLPNSSGNRYPSVYARGEVVEVPAWIAYDKQILTFDAYYEETFKEIIGHNVVIHKCKIFFFLEDGTIKVVEPKVRDSGIPQGCLITRHRIRFPATGNSDDYYDILDFNVGKEVEFYGKNFKIVNCDAFTRKFLNRLGIAVPDPVPMPHDVYQESRQSQDKKWKAPVTKKGTIQKFLALDGRILSFDAYWDDRDTECGYLHLLKVFYYLSDDTIEVKDVTEPEKPFTMVKRCQLEKVYKGLPQIGSSEPVTLLNVFGPSADQVKSMADPLNVGAEQPEYYTDKDLAIGAVVNAYGRKLNICNCDTFTQEYYRVKYGLDDFTPQPRPLTKHEQELANTMEIKVELPPYNGFGTYEDSSLNCLHIAPTSANKSYKQFYEKDKYGYDSRILRFHGKYLSKNSDDASRKFIISYYLSDDTISVFEESVANGGFQGGMMMARRQIIKPGENIYGSKPPKTYNLNDFFLGNILELENFKFQLVGLDEYAMRYMELHPLEFPQSNKDIIIDKVRREVSPKYKDFIAKLLTNKEFVPIPYMRFRQELQKALGPKITEHEILTLGRSYAADQERTRFSLNCLRRLAHDDLKRALFNAFERLREGFLHRDDSRCGYVDSRTAYSVLRGARVPLDVDMIHSILEKMGKGENCMIQYDELIDFLNFKKTPTTPFEPINEPAKLSWMTLSKTENKTCVEFVDINPFIKDLNLEKELEQQTK